MKPRKPLKRSPLPRRKTWLARSSKPIAKRGAAKERKEKPFLSSPAWKKMRREAIVRAGLKCEECGTDIAFILSGQLAVLAGTQVDHVSYARFGGKERPEDLRALCGGSTGCHARKHGNAYWRGRHR